MRIIASGIEKKALRKRFLQGFSFSTSNIMDFAK
jgi:hypothetical protein